MVGLRIVENSGKPRHSMIQNGTIAQHLQMAGLQEELSDPRKGDEI
jgi:hypothetical protein